MSQPDFISNLNILKGFIDALKNEMDTTYPQIIKALEGNTKLPPGCPSKESMVELIFRGVGKKLDEVNGLYDAVRKTIFE